MNHHLRPVVASMLAFCVTATMVLAADRAGPREWPRWGRLLDPAGDSAVSLEETSNRLKIQVPGTPHVLSAEDVTLSMNAPRVLRTIRGDFTADVRVLGRLEPGKAKTTRYDPYQGAGLIVWQDAANYLRLERAVGTIQGRPHPYLNYELRQDGHLGMSQGISIEDRPVFLRLRRQGREISASYSRDGRRWVPLGPVDAPWDDRVEVGVTAVNSAARALSVELERFSIDDPRGSMARD